MGAPSIAAGSAHVELVLDASGSMWNKLDDGRFRIVAAKQVLGDFVAGLPDLGLDVGLRVYGSKVKAKEDGACLDTELFVPLDGIDKPALTGVIEGARAVGATPIALSLEKAADDFPADATRKLVVLVTDGEEACDGDVRKAAEMLKSRGIELRIIGFDLGAEARASFEGVGAFENAADAKGLASALGRAVSELVPPLGTASLEAPESVPGGQGFEVRWQGENGSKDYVTLVADGAEDGTYGPYRYTRDGNPLSLTAPMEPGDYELRYQSDRVPGVAARRPIRVVASEVALDVPATVVAGTSLEVGWRGPNGPGDYVTIVEVEAPSGAYGSYFYTRDGSPGTIQVPFDSGAYEVRYQTERGGDADKVFARAVVEVLPVEILLDAPASAMAGSRVEVRWAGPDGRGDYVTVVEASTPDGRYASYFYTRVGNPGTVQLPLAPGRYELRYQSERQSGRVFARRAIEVTSARIQLMAPPRVKAGDMVPIRWIGPGGQSDYVTIVAEDAEAGTYGVYSYVDRGNPIELRAPAAPGRYEIRYQTDRGPEKKIVVGKVPLVVE